jgi:hypothetical protein
VFTAGVKDFTDAFRNLVDAENRCREEYFTVVDRKTGHRP